jgi:tetratricopeptide (TPR) repeat protein
MKTALVSCLFFCGFTVLTPAQSATDRIDELLRKAEQQMDEMEESGSLETYLEVLEIDPEHYDALWNTSLLHTTIGFRYNDANDQKEYFERAIEFAEKSLQHHPDKGHSYYVMAVAKGRMADVAGIRRRIELGHEVEEYIDKALGLMPEHAPSSHLYGVWQSEVANVSRAERMAARFISGGLPDGSDEKAEMYLSKAIEMDPESIIIRMDLARHYERSGQDEKAIATLEELLETDLQPQTKDDPGHLDDARKLLNDLR